jgi:hypothetical protein
MGFFSNLAGVMNSFGIGGPSGVQVSHAGGKLLVEDTAFTLTQAQGADPIALQDFVTKNYGDINYAGGSSIPATSIGQVLFSIDGLTFTAQQPVTTTSDGWLVNADGILLVAP